MARSSLIRVGSLNIKTHPHSQQKYVELFKKVFQREKPLAIRLRGDQAAAVWSIKVNSDTIKGDYINGMIYKFTDIDPKGDWFNTIKASEASESEIEQIKIPEHLKHNLSKFRFIFLPEFHYLVFESEYYDQNKKRRVSISPIYVKKLFQECLCNSEYNVFTTCEVIIEQSVKKLDEIFSLCKLNHLSIIISRPNPDLPTDLRQRILDRMDAQNIQEEHHDYSAIPGQSIIPDNETRDLAETALFDGKVTASGRDENNKKVNASTLSHPRIENLLFRPDYDDPLSLLLNKAIQMYKAKK